jgi:hypothetical protein
VTQSHDKIIAEYRDADFNRRLHMYLQFPTLRSKFISIDQRDLNDQLFEHAARRCSSLTALLSIVFSATAGFVKRLS